MYRRKYKPMSNNEMMSDELRRAATDIFLDMDTDHNGWLSREELKEGFNKLGFRMTDYMAEAAFRNVDMNVDGRITLDEFLFLIKCTFEKYPEEHRRARLRRAFKEFDTDQDGFLSMDELMNGLTRTGANITREQAEEKTDNLDKDDQGRIRFEQFVLLFNN